MLEVCAKCIAFLVGCLIGLIPVVGQLVGIGAWLDSDSGAEMSDFQRTFAYGVGVGTLGLAYLFLRYIL